MTETTETMNIRTKMMHVQVELDAPKSQYNSFGKYAYRNAEDIKQALKPLQVKYGFYMEYKTAIKVEEGVRYVEVTAYFADCDSDAKLSSNAYAKEPASKKGMSEEQVTGSASSYATKYALSNLFSIDDAEDADNFANGGSDNSSKQQQPKQTDNTVKLITDSELASVMRGIEKLASVSGSDFKDVIASVKDMANISELKEMPQTMVNDCLKWLAGQIKAVEESGNSKAMNLENM